MNERPQWLEDALRTLPREASPQHDLWPGIARRLEQKPRTQWLPVALAASVLVSVISAGFTWKIWSDQREQQALQLAQQQSARDMVQSWQQPYQTARASYAEQMPSLLANLDEQTRAEVARNLQIIQSASQNIATALEKDPNDPTLRRLLLQTLDQELSLYQQVQRAGASAQGESI